jgi:hypothetical protein
MARGVPNMAAGAAELIAASIRSNNARQRVGATADIATKIHSQPMDMRDNRSGAISASVKRRPRVNQDK